ncbi:uncharacterized protein LOC131212866 [Anopheles bellator]|uniref:uncharacterized protein LOC131212866 n=1 Tax=Anopheles bellator TaxID=139047 RepID=UPI00264757D3|nr:uncharacterized protein LOC131212866 [Anopheles bellator]
MDHSKLNGNGDHALEEVVSEYYDPVAILLSSGHYDTKNLTDELKKCSVTYDQVSGLEAEDLRLMGITNENAIKEILSDLSELVNQRRMYDSVLQHEFDPCQYATTICQNTSDHLESMRMLIKLMQLRFRLSFPNNVLLDDRYYATEMSLSLCDRICERLDNMCTVSVGVNASSKRKTWMPKLTVPLVLLSGVFVFTVWLKQK